MTRGAEPLRHPVRGLRPAGGWRLATARHPTVQPHGARQAPPDPELDDKRWDTADGPLNEPEAGEALPTNDDLSVAPPSGPLSLYRLRLTGAFTDRPTLLVTVIDGAAVWMPEPP